MSLRRRLFSFRYAWQGLRDVVETQPNMRLHLAAALAAVTAGLYLHISRLEWVAVVLCMVTVMGLEAVNTALEYLTNLVSPDYHPLAGKVKDAAAAAVLLAAVGAVAVGLLIFLPKCGLGL